MAAKKKRLSLKSLELRLKACEAQIADLYEVIDSALQDIEGRHSILSEMVQAIAGVTSPTPPTVH